MSAFARSPECKQTTDPPVAFRVDKKVGRGNSIFLFFFVFGYVGIV